MIRGFTLSICSFVSAGLAVNLSVPSVRRIAEFIEAVATGVWVEVG